MELKKEYKELRKNLKNSYPSKKNNNYSSMGGVGLWLTHCDIKPTPIKLRIICEIFGSVPYPYQVKDRETILEYLKSHKFKEFKNAK